MDFQKRVELVCRHIPHGKVASYGQIALLCGKPNYARQAGRALNRCENPAVPAHRVVNGKGVLTGALAFSYSGQQCLMLEKEGVEVKDGRQVNMKKYGWQNTMEDALLFRRLFEEEQI